MKLYSNESAFWLRDYWWLLHQESWGCPQFIWDTAREKRWGFFKRLYKPCTLKVSIDGYHYLRDIVTIDESVFLLRSDLDTQGDIEQPTADLLSSDAEFKRRHIIIIFRRLEKSICRIYNSNQTNIGSLLRYHEFEWLSWSSVLYVMMASLCHCDITFLLRDHLCHSDITISIASY